MNIFSKNYARKNTILIIFICNVVNVKEYLNWEYVLEDVLCIKFLMKSLISTNLLEWHGWIKSNAFMMKIKARENLNFTARRLFMAWVYRQQMISVATALLLY